MARNDAAPLPFSPDRRSFLYGATAVVGAAGVVAAAWPLLDQMNPDAATRASGDIVEVDAASLRPAAQRVARWRQMPIFIRRRSAEMLAAMAEPKFVARLIDPRSEKRQQPDYARNWHRSIEPDYAVLVGICTHCACIPHHLTDDARAADVAEAYFCPCCASRYDPAGRAFGGPAGYNLAVPPYSMIGRSRILIGKNPAGEMFSITSVERI